MTFEEKLALIISLVAIFINFLTILLNVGLLDWLIDLIDNFIYTLKELTEKLVGKIKRH